MRGADVQRADGSHVATLRAEYTIVADGANSRFGRALGTFRTREWPYGTAIRTYWQSPKHAEPWIESALDVKDRNGNPMPGLRLDLPGRRRHREHRRRAAVDVPRLQERQHDPPPRRLRPPDRRPLGDRRRPPRRPAGQRAHPDGRLGRAEGRATHLVVGDAAGSVNPFNGEGIDYAYETARIAADVIHEALTDGDATALQRYQKLLDDEYGQYFKVARLFARVIGRPALMRELTRAGMHSRTLMEWVLRIMANLLRPDEIGPAEAAYKAASAIVRLAPNA